MSFMSAHGYKIKNNILHQDNPSGIHMEKNGRNSRTGTSRHVDIQYFFVAYRVKKKEVNIEYYPMKIMLTDFLRKYCKEH